MIQLITKQGFEKNSESYIRTAIFYNDDGTTFEKTFTSMDLKKALS